MTKVTRPSVSAFLLATLLLGTGCQMVKAGTRCAANAAPGRDATHVLFCKNGRWTRVMTIGQAANFILSSKPAKVESLSGPITFTAGSMVPLVPMSAKVTSYTGTPVANVKVVFTMNTATNGATGRMSGTLGNTWTTVTDANGVATVSAYAGFIAGEYTASATAEGVATPALFGLINRTGTPALFPIVSGDFQSIPASATSDWMVAQLFDAYENPIANTTIETDYDPALVTIIGGDTLTTDADGFVRFRVQAGSTLGADFIALGALLPNGQYLVQEFDFQIV